MASLFMGNFAKIQIVFSALVLFVITGLATTSPVPAQAQAGPSTRSIQGDCPDGYIKLSVALENGDDCIQESGNSPNLSDNIIFRYLAPLIRVLSIGVGLVVTLMIVIAGIQYITSAGNPQGIEAAKRRLTNAVIALLLYIFMAAILNFLVPGGFL